MPLSELVELTDKQIEEIYGHPRDKDGNVKPPDEKLAAASDGAPASLEGDLRDLTLLAGMFGMPPADYAAKAEQIKAKWAARGEEPSNG